MIYYDLTEEEAIAKAKENKKKENIKVCIFVLNFIYLI
jgi:hypothetical protein